MNWWTELMKRCTRRVGFFIQCAVKPRHLWRGCKEHISNLRVFFVAQCIFEQYQLARRHSFLQNN